jgi:hypothetical protein
LRKENLVNGSDSRRRRHFPGGSGRLAAALGAALFLAALAAAPAHAWEQRRSTPSIGVQFGYGSMSGTGYHERTDPVPGVVWHYNNDDYRWGGALGLRIRYSLDQSHAVGLNFEDLRYGRKNGLAGLAGENERARQLQVNTVLFDYFIYLDRPARTCFYVLAGGGFHRDTYRFNKSENTIMPMAPAAELGLGAEYFLRPSWTIDGTLRGYWLGQRGSAEWKFRGSSPLAASLQVGIQHYLLK